MRNHKTSKNRNINEKSWLFLDHDYDHTNKNTIKRAFLLNLVDLICLFPQKSKFLRLLPWSIVQDYTLGL